LSHYISQIDPFPDGLPNWGNLEALDMAVSIDSPADVCAGGRA